MANKTAVTEKNSPRLSLCMIVRDNAKTLRIVEEFGGRLFHFPWIDDFSAARNESLRHARGQWIFWMDSDDTIDEENGRKLRELAYGAHSSSVLGYVMQVHCPGDTDRQADDFVAVDHVKMFRNLPQLRFEGRIHDHVLSAIRSLSGEVCWTDIFVVHSGADHSAEGRKKKQERDLRILHQENHERPDHPFTLFNLGMTYADMQRYDEAVGWLQRSLEVSTPAESHVRKVYALLVNSLAELGRTNEAVRVCQQGRNLFPSDPELLFRQGMLAHRFGHLDEAESAYIEALRGREERHFTSIDRGIMGYKARHNLALVYVDKGRLDLAELHWRRVVAEVPNFFVGRFALTDTLIRQGRLTAAKREVEFSWPDSASVQVVLLTARMAESRGDYGYARKLLEDAIEKHPDETQPLEELCRFNFEHGAFAEAEETLKQLVVRCLSDGAAHHNLGSVYLQMEQFDRAVAAYRKSLEVRPNFVETYLKLSQALRAANRDEEAEAAWHEALRLRADHADVKDSVAHPPERPPVPMPMNEVDVA